MKGGRHGEEGKVVLEARETRHFILDRGIHSAKERTKEHPREYLLDAPINREPVATRCTFLHRWKVRRDWKIGGEKTSFLARFTLIFTPCLRVQTSSFLFFFFPSPLPVLSTSETFLKRKFLKMKDPFFLLLLFPRDFLETRCPLFLSGKNSS